MSKNPGAMLGRSQELQISPWQSDGKTLSDLVSQVPEEFPLLMLGGKDSDWCILALAWDECDVGVVGRLRVADCASLQDGQTFPRYCLGFLVLQSYDAGAGMEGARPRAFRIRKALVCEQATNRFWLCEEPEAKASSYQVPWPLPALAFEGKVELGAWTLLGSDEDYLKNVARVIEEIRAGRYYQLNLLRYWESAGPLGRLYWLNRLQAAAGPLAAYLDMPGLGLVSCSPERFVQIEKKAEGTWIRTEPIKGTRPVRNDAEQDRQEQEALVSHPKDRAELSMIIDLMRNDLQRISYPRSVKVLDPGSIRSFSHVHHLIAQVEARLRDEITWVDLWAALCPGGSITGAPKREVMQAITEREQRKRGYLMGNIFYIDLYTGQSDSSILIRTAARRPSGIWDYAAGSGLTVNSDPLAELEEVYAKARVILG